MNMITESTQLIADILIIDDKLENIRFLSDFLSAQYYQVRKAISGQAAINAVRTLIPDLILLDINMPGMGGYDVCEQLKSDPKTSSIPIIFLSAGNDLTDKVRAFQVGGVDYITKPFQLEEVLIRVQTQLKIRELQQSLEHKNDELNQALTSLKTAQVALVQKEKMATLRKVVAGVAHEINNPLSFIACNVEPIQEYKNHLFSLVSLYRQKCVDEDPAIAHLLQEVDLDFLSADMDKIIGSMKTGTERINAVVLALRIFSRLDESEIKQIDIHDCIDATLTLLHHRLNARDRSESIKIHKEYAALPPITCYAGQLNQVIFNLLCNAIDAVEVKLAQNQCYYQPQISVCTYMTSDRQLSLSIKDNGIGILKEKQARLFEPFFTTKIAGQGIGLGLATSRSIIEELHHGSLTFHSTVDVGTEFTIQIPL